MKMKFVLSWDMLLYIIWTPALFFMVVTSRGFTLLKTVLLLLMTALCFLNILLKRKLLKRSQINYVLIFVVYFSFSLALGIMNGYEFYMNKDSGLIQYYIITPVIVFITGTCLADKSERVSYTLYFLRIITLFIIIMDIWKILAKSGILPDIDKFNLIFVSSQVNTDKLALRVSNEYAFMFLLPFYIVMLFFEKLNRDRVINSIIVIAGIIYCLLSGRKTLEIVVLGTLVFMVLYALIKARKVKILIWIAISGFILLFAAQQIGNMLGIEGIFYKAHYTISNGLSSKARGFNSRLDNITALIDLWLQSPLFGKGLNSYAPSSLANGVTKWSYEVVYNALLAQSGLIGILILLAGVIYIIRKLILEYKKTKEPVYFAVSAAFICFIISGATNPLAYIPWPWIITFMVFGKSNTLRMS